MEWDEFVTAFLDKYFPRQLREAEAAEFLNLRQNNMIVEEYTLKFTQLSRYAPEMVAEPRARMLKFVSRVSNLVLKECRTAILIKDIDLSSLIIHA